MVIVFDTFCGVQTFINYDEIKFRLRFDMQISVRLILINQSLLFM